MFLDFKNPDADKVLFIYKTDKSMKYFKDSTYNSITEKTREITLRSVYYIVVKSLGILWWVMSAISF